MIPWVIGNWKLNPATLDESTQLLQGIAAQLQKLQKPNICQVMVAPSFLHLSAASATLTSCLDTEVSVPTKNLTSNGLSTKVNIIKLAGQDVTALTDATGAYTGDVSAKQLKDLGVEWVILGHSERRQYYAEDNESLLRKLMHCASHGLGIVFCIGESEAAFVAGQTEAVLTEQLLVLHSFVEAIEHQYSQDCHDNNESNDSNETNANKGHSNIANVRQTLKQVSTAKQLSRLIVAYEPVWAIGTGKVANVQQVELIHHFIRQQLVSFDNRLTQTPIIYGGSVNASNVDEFAACSEVNGVLVGGAALEAQSFVNIVQSFCSE